MCFSRTPAGAQLGVNRSNLLLRGCVLRNTNAVVGVVVYAGEEVFMSTSAVVGVAMCN